MRHLTLRLVLVLTIGVLGCDPKTAEYEITVKNDFPGTRIGIYSSTGTLPLATTTKAEDKLVVRAPFKENLGARFVDTNVKKVALDAVLNGPDKRTLTKEGKRVPLNLFASRVRDFLIADVELVLGGPTDERITVGEVTVDSKAVAAGSRLRVPVRTGPVDVRIGTEPPVRLVLEPLGERESGPAGFVWIDPTGTTCVQTRSVFYGAMHVVPGAKGPPDPPVKLASAKIHAFTKKDAPDVIVDEKVPDSIMGSFIGSRRVLERCTAPTPSTRNK